MPEGTRLNKFLASCGVGSRRACDAMVQDGRVEINGKPCLNPAQRVEPGDFVRVDGKRVHAKETMTQVSALLSPENQATLVTTVANLGTAASGISTASNHVEQVAVEARKTLRGIEATSTELTKSAAEARTVAVDFGKSIQRISDTFGETSNALVSAAHQFNVTTLPRVHRVSDDTSNTMRQATSVLTNFNDNPQSLLYGSGAISPGPGEPGFIAPRRTP